MVNENDVCMDVENFSCKEKEMMSLFGDIARRIVLTQPGIKSLTEGRGLVIIEHSKDNVIIKDNGEYHIIDWAHATQGNASADVAKTFLLFSVNGQAELAEKYLNMITEKGGLEKRGIQRWIPIVAAVQLKKGEVEDRKTLEKWVDVVDYE